MEKSQAFQTGDRFVVGSEVLVLSEELASSMKAGDSILAVSATHSLKRIPSAVHSLVDTNVTNAMNAFSEMSRVDGASIDLFFEVAARLLQDDDVFRNIEIANQEDVADAYERQRSTTRLVLSQKMREDMVSAFDMWRTSETTASYKIDEIRHGGWSVEQWRAPLGVIGFVFEGRPNVFADATGVLKSGNTVVFRIGSDALRTAQAIMEHIIRPALSESGLPLGAVQLVESREHAAGWRLFADARLSLAVARGSGEAVAELGSIAQQSGVPVSLHGTGGAWMIVGESANLEQLSDCVEHSLDRKVCNTLNVVCIPSSIAPTAVTCVFDAAVKAASKRGTQPRIHAVNGAEVFLDEKTEIQVHRPAGVTTEKQVTTAHVSALGNEFEWEENPEFFVVQVASTQEAIDLFNRYSPQFIVSAVTSNGDEENAIWSGCNAPFMGNGFTRWVDGQFSLLRPELGLSNWQNGRLFSRGGVLSGDSAFTVRLRVRQEDSTLHR
ncbi:MAG: aldehyde dehydrogenase family protein [Actinomycetes bacterium]